ncbi:hypothetical protein ABB30_09365 [Stenotrophomonas ginsengisoli]|uniref:Uncharacterized protein n=1 Tax=Stenotrophomonas ginsengisoli TaxID=336566 RepID=A0A0R0DDZ8_9GAMM|nr:hypothetical protein ABB30_09365 [Stenotrophomonas ginsengisoli]
MFVLALVLQCLFLLPGFLVQLFQRGVQRLLHRLIPIYVYSGNVKVISWVVPDSKHPVVLLGELDFIDSWQRSTTPRGLQSQRGRDSLLVLLVVKNCQVICLVESSQRLVETRVRTKRSLMLGGDSGVGVAADALARIAQSGHGRGDAFIQ